MALPREVKVNRQLMTMFVLAGLAALGVAIFLAWCPPDACRVLNIQTYAISDLDKYRQFVADEPAFRSLHHVRAVRLDCSALRDDVVTALETGRLTLGVSQPNGTQRKSAQSGPVQSWHQGRLLHMKNSASGTDQEQESWAVTIRATVAGQLGQELSFLPRLFGGLVLHVHNKQIPVVFFSDQPCV